MADRLAHGRKPETPETGEDAFVAGMFRLGNWIVHNLRTTILIVGAVAILVAGVMYYRGYRETVRERAALELAQIRAGIAGTEPAAIAAQLEGFIERFSGTTAETEARLLLGRIYIDAAQNADALRVLEGVRPSIDVPLGFAGRSLLIIAHERNGEPERAIEMYLELGESARYPFQQRDAQANAARILADLGRLEEAIEIYARIAAEAEGVDPAQAGIYRLRLGELRGRLATPES